MENCDNAEDEKDSKVKTVPKEKDELEKCEDKMKGKPVNILEEEEHGTLFRRLHLQDKLQQKMSLADFLMISSLVKQDHETLEKDLACRFLQRLMMLDYRARYIPVKQQCPEGRSLETVTVDTDESDDDDFCSNSVKPDQLKQTHIHPMDVQMAVFHCSDSFLQQNMVTKLSQCQYALPLLVPHPLTGEVHFPLWTFRQIIKTWRTPPTMTSVPVYKAQTHMVSFLRLGSLSVSKSQLMNDLINERHSTFFHRNCAGSTKSRLLMDGVAEIAWYCPAGKANDAFTACIAFCNLHGDALEFKRQREILLGKSSVNVVLVPTLEKGDKSWTVIEALLKSEKPLICLMDDSCDAVVKKKGNYKMGLKDRSLADVSAELKKIIGKILSGPHESFQLEALAEVSEFKVDENTLCLEGKSAAVKIVNLLYRTDKNDTDRNGKSAKQMLPSKMDVSKIKDEFLRCHGDLWQNWCRINKELYHLTGNIEKEKSKKQQQLMQIRRDQCKASCSEVMKLFINSLSSLPSSDKEYFLKWTQILIDALSTDDLCSILQDYDKTWSEVLALKKEPEKSDQLKTKQTELEQISQKLQSATFGLEHIFREMGQIFEAHKSLDKPAEEDPTHWSKYPALAAELLISGHPLELMDGDACHVPLTWISSVLHEVRRKVGDRRVFVLSVLGVQSSGKSTMLNAMFGLQFAVSAGRCTKGAFMQLLKVSEEMDLRFDYILVVDTEGLRALELEGNDTLHHDNELATFVVGLGNMTLINIFGENPADMQDVLQIVVQAFMRMKKVKLSPSCVFVHQNVTDITATEKNLEGKRRLQEKLDQMVQLAAKEEGSDAESFSDIIAFDVQTDVKYFAQLWEGSPPMAPPNPGYSESVQELKDFILSKASRSDGVTLSQFSGKIQDLWNALLNENFVFSFKNTLEIAVYRKLEVQYGNWTWTLRSNMLTIENQLHTRIENGKLDKVELSYLYKEISETYEEIKSEMTKYFEDDKDREMLVQWRNQFAIKIEDFNIVQVKEVKRKLDEVLLQKKACKKWEETKTEFETKLLQKSKELAQKLREKAKNEEELKKQFDSVWSDWVKELTEGLQPVEDIKMEEEQLKILQELGFECKLIDDRKKKLTYKKMADLKDYSDYFSKSVWKFWKTSTLPPEEQHHLRTFIDRVEKQSMDTFKTKPVASSGFSSAYLQEVAKDIKGKVAEGSEREKKYFLMKEFTVDLCLFVFDRAESWFIESHKKFKMKNDPNVFLETKREQYYNIFSSYCREASSAVVLGGLICENLKVSIIEAVYNRTAVDLTNEIKCSHPAFNGNRLDLEKHVLKSLAEKEDFEDYINYIHHPRKHMESFITGKVSKYIFKEQKEKAQKILKKNVEDMKNLVSNALFTATDKVKSQRGNIDMWLKEFTSSLIEKNLKSFIIPSQNFSDINKFDHLKDEVETGLTSIVTEMSSLSLDKMKEFGLQPDQILIEHLCSCCWVQCPFCSALCTNTMENHDGDHSVPFHRSIAVNGWHYIGTEEMSIEFCTTKVAGDGRFRPSHDSNTAIPYKLYRTAGPEYENWRITPDGSNLSYWKWFVCRFKAELEQRYNKKFQGDGEIPRDWKECSKDNAIKSLDEM
ncbi:interferon-induced very large GTPase 1-like [Betta splendens]|uniref:Interferon-induced very large GTPase 1-like n=1 Tax=Betta splendens TaxID=158456 RepID=A0A6P7N798_BETSP|nr:interferon-induced very large GTPase 1-like [Betta splendens]